jgi:hypothetical protein
VHVFKKDSKTIPVVKAHVYIDGELINFTFVRKIENMKEDMVISLKDFGLGKK